MFTVDPAMSDVKIREKKPFKVLFSMNIHPVANPEMSLEEARTYVFFCREGRGKISVYIGLHFLPSDRKLFYTHSVNPFVDAQLSDMEEEARRFGEDLGAMLDEVDFSRMSDLEQMNWINDLEILSDRKKEPDLPKESAAQDTAPAASDEQAGVPPHDPSPQVAPVQSAPVQPAPEQAATIQPSPVAAAQPAPVQPHAQQQQAQEVSAGRVPAAQPVQVQASPAPPAAPARKPVQPRQPRKAAQSRPAAAPEPEPSPMPHADSVLEEAVKAGVVKAPTAQLKNHIRSTAGIVSREKEALARLLASF